MWEIVGLGNPGRKYSNTRHNVGFMVLDLLCSRHGVQLKEKDDRLEGRGSIGGTNVAFMEPLSYMNLSGHPTRASMRNNYAKPDTLIVIQDDMDMEVGKFKIKDGGGAGGHNGIRSIIGEIGTRDFIRVKVGIGKDESRDTTGHVLGKFKPDEKPLISEAIEIAADAVEEILTNGLEKAMNQYNQKT